MNIGKDLPFVLWSGVCAQHPPSRWWWWLQYMLEKLKVNSLVVVAFPTNTQIAVLSLGARKGQLLQRYPFSFFVFPPKNLFFLLPRLAFNFPQWKLKQLSRVGRRPFSVASSSSNKWKWGPLTSARGRPDSFTYFFVLLLDFLVIFTSSAGKCLPS